MSDLFESYMLIDILKRFSPEVTEKQLIEMKVITEDHILRYLPQARLGLLVGEVYTALTDIENQTGLEVIMRGLLPPHEKRKIEKLAMLSSNTLISGEHSMDLKDL